MNEATKEAAYQFLQRGWSVIPIPCGQKAPGIKDWPRLRLQESDIEDAFMQGGNIGVLLGDASNGLVDVDIDSAEALRIADNYLPKTEAVFGRPATPRSHRLYVCNPSPSNLQCRAVAGEMVVEIRSSGLQTVFPPSSHSGEQVAWASTGEPARVEATVLQARVCELAAAALFARHWPSKGSRQEAAMALAGALLRDGFTEDRAELFLGSVAQAADDEEAAKRIETAAYTRRRAETGQKSTGWPRLEAILGSQVIQSLRSLLNSVRNLSQSPAENSEDPSRKQQENCIQQKTVAALLVELAMGVELFHTSDASAYVAFPAENHYETWRVQSPAFRHWLRRIFVDRYDKLPSRESLNDAIEVLEYKALFENPERPVFFRVGFKGENIFLDLGSAEWTAIEISTEGWKIVSNPPVHFRRTAGMRPLAVPAGGGDYRELRGLLNARSDRDWVLMIGWLLCSFRPVGPYLILVLQGEAGTAKSSAARMLRSLIDPSVAPLRSAPSNEDDLLIAAKNAWIVALDNLSGISHWLSDALCRLATGGGLSKRKLFTDEEEIIIEAVRPLVLTGIEDLAAREDLGERSINLVLSPIPRETRRNERSLEAEFRKAQPQILGSLLDAVACALRHIDEVSLERPPRMVDAIEWVTAAESNLGWPQGTFQKAFEDSQTDATAVCLETDLLAAAINELLAEYDQWSGTCSELLAILNARNTPELQKSKNWPHSPRSLSGRIRRLAGALRSSGIEIDFSREPVSRRRLLSIRRQSVPTVPTVSNDAGIPRTGARRDGQNGSDESQPNQADPAFPRLESGDE
jgi:hypothetical protein